MNYDQHFIQERLDQLAAQCLSDNIEGGKIIFLSDAEDNSMELASWRFENQDKIRGLLKGEFRVYLLELVDKLMIDRAKNNQPNSRQCVVYVDGNRLELKWVTREEAEALR
ncbi:hypothetical protein QQF73_00535 [Marinobacter sp. M216]|uniref:Uncharacterized protein n=1 Tax=Marinobacter albus TaxID=3030833 RepID=A0ABT7H984_9GAMM|nr:hypothetical protein [Marinobacter sp. M216]MDK9556090.1 hypothetical protein [Marinobacter sp. M216]